MAEKQQKTAGKAIKNSHFWNFHAATEENEVPELLLYGDISAKTWFGDEITPKQFAEEFNALGSVPKLIVRINSGGGDIFAANAIYTLLKDSKTEIIVKIDGWAASAATVVAMAGDTICIPASAAFMIHDPSMGVTGYFSAEEFTKLADELNVVKNCIVNAYAHKTGKSKEEISAIMEAETWYTGEEAVESGFCDEVMFAEKPETAIENDSKIIVNSVAFDMSRFPNAPISLLNCATDSTNKKTKETIQMEIKSIDALKETYPELTKQLTDRASAAERTRIREIEDVALAGFDTIVNKAKFETPITAGELAAKIVAEQKKQGETYLENRNRDAETGNANNVGNSAQESIASHNQENQFVAAINKLYPKAK